MNVRFGVASDGGFVYLVVDTPEEALEAAKQGVKSDGNRRFVVRIVPLKRVTSNAQPPPEPTVEDE